MPSIIPHVPIGIQAAMEDADEQKIGEIRSNPFNPATGEYEQGELQNARARLAQEGQYQRGELGQHQEQIQNEAQDRAGQLALRAREIQSNAALRGKQIDAETAYRQATLEEQQQKIQDLQQYRDENEGLKAQGQGATEDYRNQGMLQRGDQFQQNYDQRRQQLTDEYNSKMAQIAQSQQHESTSNDWNQFHAKFNGTMAQIRTLQSQLAIAQKSYDREAAAPRIQALQSQLDALYKSVPDMMGNMPKNQVPPPAGMPPPGAAAAAPPDATAYAGSGAGGQTIQPGQLKPLYRSVARSFYSQYPQNLDAAKQAMKAAGYDTSAVVPDPSQSPQGQ